MTPVEAAELACASYKMYENDTHPILYPELEASVSYRWLLVRHLTALDAILDAQALGIGERTWFGFVAQSRADSTEFAVVIRGTQTGLEWVIDLEATVGFSSIYDSMEIDGVRASQAIADLVQSPATITVVGHSLGAAMATYMTKELTARAKLGTHVKGIFLASPKPGDARFSQSFDAVVGADNYRVYNYRWDLVPTAPPSALGFRSLPSLTILRPYESTYKIPFDLKKNHQAESYLKLLQTRSIQ